MKDGKFNLHVVDDDESTVYLLRNFLAKKFRNQIHVSPFYSGEDCLDHIREDTDMVVLDYYMKGQNGLEVLESIKFINPSTEVLMFSNNEDITAAIECFRKGARDYIIKDAKAFHTIAWHIHKMITEPIHVFVRELALSRYSA